jgi:hypothetical protein
MYKQKGLICLLVLMAALIGSGSTQPVWGKDKGVPPANNGGKADQQLTLREAGNQTAALRKSKGKMRSTTNDDRWAAAKRHSARHAAGVAKREGGSK